MRGARHIGGRWRLHATALPPPAPYSQMLALVRLAMSRWKWFLRAIHKAACTVFATVLGPEANRAHKNHFHLDMAVRRHNTTICE